MSFAAVKDKARSLFEEAAFISRIDSEADYQQALALMDELVESYEEFGPLIQVLAASIEHWEERAAEFADFNRRVAELDGGVAVLRTLMDQYQLKTGDFRDEIGGKSMVSMILSGSRQLSREHIQALSKRFNISPALFFDRS